MMRWRCASESDTVRAVRTGEWPGRLRGHVADCPVCHDVALVAAALGRDRRRRPAEPPVASPGRVWWMAQLRARHTAAERALRPISVMEWTAVAATVPVAAGTLASVLPSVASWLAEFRVVPMIEGMGSYAALPMAAVASAALAILLLALTGLLTRADG